MTDAGLKVIVTSDDKIIKDISLVKSHVKLSLSLKAVQTEVNQFLSSLITKTGENEEDSGSTDNEWDDEIEELKGINTIGIKRPEQNTESNKKIKKI